MLYDLLEHNISDVDLRSFPRTSALMDQISSTMTTVQKFWFERLREGTLSRVEPLWKGEIYSDLLYDNYVEFSQKLGEKYRMPASQFGRALRRLCPETQRRRINADRSCGNHRPWALYFPDLERCRELFESIVNMTIDWEEED